MQTRRNYSITQTILWSSKYLVIMFIYSSVVVALYELLGKDWLKIPWLPMSVIGVAVAFFLGFKNNASYDRLWEARKIWGAIVNTSRSWAISVRDLITDTFTDVDQEELDRIHKELVYRHIAWLTALRHQLRERRRWEHRNKAKEEAYFKGVVPEYRISLEDDLGSLIPSKERESIIKSANAATQLISRQSERLKVLRKEGLIDEFRHMKLQDLLIDLYTQQGKSERIKNYPFPRQYATYNTIAVWIFAFLLPLGMIDTFHDVNVWLAIPFSSLIGWLYFTMEMIGDYSENPFEGSYNDIPITALSRTIEIDLREILGEEDLPEPIKPVHDFLY
ncbi:bestrophin family protein [Fulvivirga sedimenti]|uniref:Multidrug transporter n=1 Tax=Fulvivirga sedimenti TaxID=2879465 RepID=A0A9X1HPD6_9BACT|nr:bestrophin family ion channel [Fulvivirga sedimenti]MCA6074706.1 multidrug transporter [Fulvivirga sedimenti]MCA6075883.1 multidrug transporter [Fulvivirga sedimenti]MCA6077011.1 multidrug transporter [Fulvivirga sedimenti]